MRWFGRVLVMVPPHRVFVEAVVEFAGGRVAVGLTADGVGAVA